MINKNQYKIANDKKVLHKIGKQWVTVSAMSLALLGASSIATTVHANADTTTNNNKSTVTSTAHIQSNASNLYNKITSNNSASSKVDSGSNVANYAPASVDSKFANSGDSSSTSSAQVSSVSNNTNPESSSQPVNPPVHHQLGLQLDAQSNKTWIQFQYNNMDSQPVANSITTYDDPSNYMKYKKDIPGCSPFFGGNAMPVDSSSNPSKTNPNTYEFVFTGSYDHSKPITMPNDTQANSNQANQPNNPQPQAKTGKIVVHYIDATEGDSDFGQSILPNKTVTRQLSSDSDKDLFKTSQSDCDNADIQYIYKDKPSDQFKTMTYQQVSDYIHNHSDSQHHMIGYTATNYGLDGTDIVSDLNSDVGYGTSDFNTVTKQTVKPFFFKPYTQNVYVYFVRDRSNIQIEYSDEDTHQQLLPTKQFSDRTGTAYNEHPYAYSDINGFHLDTRYLDAGFDPNDLTHYPDSQPNQGHHSVKDFSYLSYLPNKDQVDFIDKDTGWLVGQWSSTRPSDMNKRDYDNNFKAFQNDFKNGKYDGLSNGYEVLSDSASDFNNQFIGDTAKDNNQYHYGKYNYKIPVVKKSFIDIQFYSSGTKNGKHLYLGHHKVWGYRNQPFNVNQYSQYVPNNYTAWMVNNMPVLSKTVIGYNPPKFLYDNQIMGVYVAPDRPNGFNNGADQQEAKHYPTNIKINVVPVNNHKHILNSTIVHGLANTPFNINDYGKLIPKGWTAGKPLSSELLGNNITKFSNKNQTITILVAQSRPNGFKPAHHTYKSKITVNFLLNTNHKPVRKSVVVNGQSGDGFNINDFSKDIPSGYISTNPIMTLNHQSINQFTTYDQSINILVAINRPNGFKPNPMINVSYVNINNHINVKSFGTKGKINNQFNNQNYINQIPNGYHFVKVLAGTNINKYHYQPQYLVIGVKRNQRSIKINYLDKDSHQPISQSVSSTALTGTKFSLNNSDIKDVNGYIFTNVIDGNDINTYQKGTYNINLYYIKLSHPNHAVGDIDVFYYHNHKLTLYADYGNYKAGTPFNLDSIRKNGFTVVKGNNVNKFNNGLQTVILSGNDKVKNPKLPSDKMVVPRSTININYVNRLTGQLIAKGASQTGIVGSDFDLMDALNKMPNGYVYGGMHNSTNVFGNQDTTIDILVDKNSNKEVPLPKSSSASVPSSKAKSSTSSRASKGSSKASSASSSHKRKASSASSKASSGSNKATKPSSKASSSTSSKANTSKASSQSSKASYVPSKSVVPSSSAKLPDSSQASSTDSNQSSQAQSLSSESINYQLSDQIELGTPLSSSQSMDQSNSSKAPLKSNNNRNYQSASVAKPSTFRAHHDNTDLTSKRAKFSFKRESNHSNIVNHNYKNTYVSHESVNDNNKHNQANHGKLPQTNESDNTKIQLLSGMLMLLACSGLGYLNKHHDK